MAPTHLLARIGWVFAPRPFSPEMEVALRAGTLRGADLWHVATALYLAPSPRDIFFVTGDRRQQRVADGLGFKRLTQTPVNGD